MGSRTRNKSFKLRKTKTPTKSNMTQRGMGVGKGKARGVCSSLLHHLISFFNEWGRLDPLVVGLFVDPFFHFGSLATQEAADPVDCLTADSKNSADKRPAICHQVLTPETLALGRINA